MALWIELDPIWPARNSALNCAGRGIVIAVSSRAEQKTREAATVLSSVINDALLLKDPADTPLFVIRPASKLPPEPPSPNVIEVLVGGSTAR
jgi:hypothetical protein